MYKRILYGLCAASLLIACQKDILEPKEEIVVEGWIESDGYPVVMLSRTFVVTTGAETGKEQSIVLPWGKVTVSDGTQSAVLTGDYDEHYVPPFRYSTSKIRGIPGKTYYLTVEYDDRVLTAQTTIPMPDSLETLEVNMCENLDSAYQITASFKDNPETKDYYLFLTRIFNRESRFYPAFLGAINDERLVGLNLHVIQPGIHRLTSNNHNYGPYFRETDSVQIKFAKVDETTYSIHKAYEELMILANNTVFASDVSLPTNIRGGLGYWCGYASTKYNVIIADSIM